MYSYMRLKIRDILLRLFLFVNFWNVIILKLKENIIRYLNMLLNYKSYSDE